MSLDAGYPICQDTGSIMAIISAKPGKTMIEISSAITDAVRQLTQEGILRQNCVDSVTEKNTGDNTGKYAPQIYFIPDDNPPKVYFMLKGGGSENVSTQYSLPDNSLSAQRDFDGVRRCVLDTVFKAQGNGCAPGIVGVCIGSDRGAGYLHAKKQLFRKLDDTNPIPELAKIEDTILKQANSLGIGPMGLGGKTTLLGVKAMAAERHPASYFVTVSYSCWALRRYGVELDDKGRISKWL
jgi:fumarate hydratase class I